MIAGDSVLWRARDRAPKAWNSELSLTLVCHCDLVLTIEIAATIIANSTRASTFAVGRHLQIPKPTGEPEGRVYSEDEDNAL